MNIINPVMYTSLPLHSNASVPNIQCLCTYHSIPVASNFIATTLFYLIQPLDNGDSFFGTSVDASKFGTST
jgi:hypothetical protein